MDFSLSPELLEMKEAIRSFIDDTVDPVSDRIEKEDLIPGHILQMSKDIGVLGISIPEEYGGLGINMVGKCGICEEIGRTSNGFTTVIGGHGKASRFRNL